MSGLLQWGFIPQQYFLNPRASAVDTMEGDYYIAVLVCFEPLLRSGLAHSVVVVAYLQQAWAPSMNAFAVYFTTGWVEVVGRGSPSQQHPWGGSTNTLERVPKGVVIVSSVLTLPGISVQVYHSQRCLLR